MKAFFSKLLNGSFIKASVFIILSFSNVFFFTATFATESFDPAPPDVMEDHIVVVIQKEVVFNVLSNDRLHGVLSGVYILENPVMGTVSVNPDHTLSYMPENECDQTDRFTYVVSNGVEMDTVSVFVEILCEPLTIFSGFSPDGDGMNDTFTIKGVQGFPNNSLSVFDYTGKEIFRKEQYLNDWNGSELSEPLSEDLTYFYIFNDGEGHYFSGYFKVDY